MNFQESKMLAGTNKEIASNSAFSKKNIEFQTGNTSLL